MMPSDNSRRDYAVLAVSLAMAGIFIYAGIDKIRDPLQFADSIAAFGILPAVFINLLALGLPPFEIACGLLLLGPRTRRIGALAITLLSCNIFHSLGVRAASRSHARLRLFRDRRAVATKNVAGARAGHGVVRGRAVRIFALDRPAVAGIIARRK